MAITSIGTKGTVADFTSSSSWSAVIGGATAWAAGDWLAVSIAIDNIGTTDAADNGDVTGISGEGVTWVKLGEYTRTRGAAGAGCTASVWMAQNTTGSSIGTVNITISLSGSSTDKALSSWLFGASSSLALVPGSLVGNVVNVSTDFGSVSISGLPSVERLYFRGLAKEANSSTQITPTTNFTAITATRSRNNSAAMLVRGEFRINTSTGETSNPTLAIVGDAAGVFFALSEGEPAAGGQPTIRRFGQITRGFGRGRPGVRIN